LPAGKSLALSSIALFLKKCMNESEKENRSGVRKKNGQEAKFAAKSGSGCCVLVHDMFHDMFVLYSPDW
jgi:hypothetical protein